jgi:hypothetical protein
MRIILFPRNSWLALLSSFGLSLLCSFGIPWAVGYASLLVGGPIEGGGLGWFPSTEKQMLGTGIFLLSILPALIGGWMASMIATAFEITRTDAAIPILSGVARQILCGFSMVHLALVGLLKVNKT